MRIIVSLLLVFFSLIVSAQPFQDKTRRFLKKSILPASLITTGLILKSNNHRAGDLSIKEMRDTSFPHFQTKVDDFLQFAPLATVFALQINGLKATHDWRNVLWITLKSELLMAALTGSLKHTTRVRRPDGMAGNSFPSGHTSQAFVAATILHHEYGERSIWYSIGGYTCAGMIGALRILNNRHWASDVLAGAGIGILSTEFIYAAHRGTLLKSSTLIMPAYSPLGGVQILLVHHFR